MLNLSLLALCSLVCSVCGAVAGFALASGAVAVALLAIVGLGATVHTLAALVGRRIDAHARTLRRASALHDVWAAAGARTAPTVNRRRVAY